jgi:hypothetical protein
VYDLKLARWQDLIKSCRAISLVRWSLRWSSKRRFLLFIWRGWSPGKILSCA